MDLEQVLKSNMGQWSCSNIDQWSYPNIDQWSYSNIDQWSNCRMGHEQVLLPDAYRAERAAFPAHGGVRLRRALEHVSIPPPPHPPENVSIHQNGARKHPPLPACCLPAACLLPA